MSPEPRRKLLDSIRAGDRDALQRFIDSVEARLRRRIHGKLRQHTRSIFDSDDGLQEVRVRADRALLTGKLAIRREAELAAWLGRIVANITLDANRGARRRGDAETMLAERGGGRRTSGGTDDPDDLKTVLDPLSEAEGQAVMDRFGRGIPIESCAGDAGVPPEALRSRLRRLLARLRRRRRTQPS